MRSRAWLWMGLLGSFGGMGCGPAGAMEAPAARAAPPPEETKAATCLTRTVDDVVETLLFDGDGNLVQTDAGRCPRGLRRAGRPAGLSTMTPTEGALRYEFGHPRTSLAGGRMVPFNRPSRAVPVVPSQSNYLEIERARFGARLSSRIDVDEDLDGHSIPPMLLQPLVENAVLHGLAHREEGGSVLVRGRSERDVMVLTVSDDGVGPDGSKHHGNSTGLRNLKERLALTYGDAARFSARARAGGGFECELRVPRQSTA